jgi:hypothetical protein
MEKQNNKPMIHHSQCNTENGYSCSWKMKDISEKLIEETHDWTDKKVEVIGPYIWIKKYSENPLIYELNITGMGHDGRCHWCQTFRTVLEKRCNEEYNSILLYKSCCEFD